MHAAFSLKFSSKVLGSILIRFIVAGQVLKSMVFWASKEHESHLFHSTNAGSVRQDKLSPDDHNTVKRIVDRECCPV